MENEKNKRSLKQRFLHEFTEYWINFAYMAMFFGAIVFYRTLVLAQHGIIVEDYFLGIIKALVFAKVIMIGAFLSISRKYEHQPLIIPTVYKALIFTLLIMIFDIIEIYIKAFINTPDFSEAYGALMHHINPAWFGAALVIFVSFLPFFAMKELSRILGAGKFRQLFLKKQESPISK